MDAYTKGKNTIYLIIALNLIAFALRFFNVGEISLWYCLISVALPLWLITGNSTAIAINKFFTACSMIWFVLASIFTLFIYTLLSSPLNTITLLVTFYALFFSQNVKAYFEAQKQK